MALFVNVAVAAAPRVPAKKQQSSKKSQPSSAQTKHRRTSKSSKKPAAAVRRTVQQQPTPDRYKEIQQALIDKGYLNGPPEGTWGPSSVDALKRFQRDQNLTDDGKIGSLSLIALGLGPKRSTQADPAPDKQP